MNRISPVPFQALQHETPDSAATDSAERLLKQRLRGGIECSHVTL